MDLGQKYTVQMTMNGLIITDEKGEVLNRYHVDHLLKRWNKSCHASIYLCWGINRKSGGYAHKIGFSNDIDRRMQQLGLNIIHHTPEPSTPHHGRAKYATISNTNCVKQAHDVMNKV